MCTGLLGGAVYVNAFTLISRHVDPLRREFSLAAASLGDSLGIAFADIAGILIQVPFPPGAQNPASLDSLYHCNLDTTVSRGDYAPDPAIHWIHAELSLCCAGLFVQGK